MAWVYMLLCADGSYYVGSTRCLENRLDDHYRGKGARFTKRRLPVQLVFAQEFERVDEAWALERQLHGWGRAKRRALAEGRFDLLPGLSRRGVRKREQD